MRYIVKIGYNRFEFRHPVTAMDFAELAKKTYISKKDDEIEVSIEIEIEDEEE